MWYTPGFKLPEQGYDVEWTDSSGYVHQGYYYEMKWFSNKDNARIYYTPVMWRYLESPE